MKKYIILTGGISNMGGAEMLTNNKAKYLLSDGWDVQVYFFLPVREIRLKGLLPYKENYVPEIALPISFYRRKERCKVVKRLCEKVGPNDDVIIESQLYGLALWGEMAAQQTGGNHIMYCIEENNTILNEGVASFFEFKLMRHEILNASEKAMQRHFGQYYKQEYMKYSHKGGVFCANVVSDDVKDNLILKEADYNILTIGRLDKPYIPTMMEEVRLFAEQNKDITSNFIVIGGSPEGKVEDEFKKMFETLANVELHMLGYVFPIPCELVRKCDVTIASSNSVLIGYEQGIPSIAVCAYDYLGLGVYGETTHSKMSRSEEDVAKPIHILLDEVLIEKKFKKTEPRESAIENEGRNLLKSQVAYACEAPKDKKYYNVEAIYGKGECFKNQLKLKIHRFVRQYRRNDGY